MHFLSSTIALLFASLSAIATADLSIDSVPAGLSVGDKYNIQWTTDSAYALELLLVQDTGSNGWAVVEKIFDGKVMSSGNGSHLWTVPNVNSHETFGLWLEGVGTGEDNSGYAYLTPWFKISGGTLLRRRGITQGQLAGIIIGAVAAVFAIVTGGWFCVRRRRASKRDAVAEASQPGEDRRSMDSIEVEKERARAAAKGTQV